MRHSISKQRPLPTPAISSDTAATEKRTYCSCRAEHSHAATDPISDSVRRCQSTPSIAAASRTALSQSDACREDAPTMGPEDSAAGAMLGARLTQSPAVPWPTVHSRAGSPSASPRRPVNQVDTIFAVGNLALCATRPLSYSGQVAQLPNRSASRHTIGEQTDCLVGKPHQGESSTRTSRCQPLADQRQEAASFRRRAAHTHRPTVGSPAGSFTRNTSSISGLTADRRVSSLL